MSIPAIFMIGVLSYVLFSWAFGSSETLGPTPSLLYPAVPLDGATVVEKLLWSPSGDFILIEAAVPSGSSEPRIGLVVVLDLANRSVASRMQGASHAFWGVDDSVWVWANGHWNVYAPPFHSFIIWESGYGEQSEFEYVSEYVTRSWALSTYSKRLAVATGAEDSDEVKIRIFENAKESFALQLTPRYPNGSMRSPSLTFSPSGRLLAVVISGWIGYESPGPEELWLVDVEEQTVSHVHNGKDRWWQIFDGDIQSLDPSWATSEDAVVYGDDFFGIEELSIPGAESRTIVGKRSEVYDVVISPTGRWIAFDHWPGEEGRVDKYDRCFGVVSRDGRRILHLPREFINWPYMYKDWHPKEDVLAVLRRNAGQRTHDLFYWDLREGAPNQAPLQRTPPSGAAER